MQKRKKTARKKPAEQASPKQRIRKRDRACKAKTNDGKRCKHPWGTPQGDHVRRLCVTHAKTQAPTTDSPEASVRKSVAKRGKAPVRKKAQPQKAQPQNTQQAQFSASLPARTAEEAREQLVGALRELLTFSVDSVVPPMSKWSPAKEIKRTVNYEVDEDELQKMRPILRYLLDVVFGLDGDGDPCVELELTDRQRYFRASYSAIMYARDAEGDPEAQAGRLRVLQLNADIANRELAQETGLIEQFLYEKGRADARLTRAQNCRSRGCENGWVKLSRQDLRDFKLTYTLNNEKAPAGYGACQKCQIKDPGE